MIYPINSSKEFSYIDLSLEPTKNRNEHIALDLLQFYARLKDYPGSYLTPAEHQAFDQVLVAFNDLVGIQIWGLNRAAQIQFVKDVIEVCVKTFHPEVSEKE